MKTLNRTLSLVLVLVMVLGLFGVASAKFNDDATIQYKEAVDVAVGIGAIDGYADGTFNPKGDITREEAAKLITYAILGPTLAKTLSVSNTGFKDVAATRWSAPFITYLVNKGIINGMGDGTFDPTGKVTSYQLGKMLLTAAGYGKNGEYTGASWELNTAVDAGRLKVFEGSKSTNFAAPATREEAALYVFNGLTKVAQVAWSKDKEAYEPSARGTIGVEVYGLAKSASTTADAFGRPASAWTITSKTAPIALTPAAPVATFNDASYVRAFASYDFASDVKILVNGKAISGLSTVSDLTGRAYNGVGIELYNTDTDKDIEVIALTQAYLAKITTFTAAKGSTPASLVLTVYNPWIPTTGLDTKTVTDTKATDDLFDKLTAAGYGKDDYLLVYTDAAVANADVLKFAKVTTAAGALNSYSATGNTDGFNGSVTVGGTKYTLASAAVMNNVPGFISNEGTGDYQISKFLNKNVTVFIDEYGMAIGLVGEKVVDSTTYGLVLGYQYNPATLTKPASADILLAQQDGTVSVVAQPANASGVVENLTSTLTAGKFVSYTIADSKLTKIDAAGTLDTLEADYAARGVMLDGAANVYLDSTTTVIYFNTGAAYNATTNPVRVVTGYANTVAATSGTKFTYVLKNNSTVAKVVFVPIVATPTVAGNSIYILDTTASVSAVNGATVYTYNGFINGAAGTVVVDAANKVPSAGLYNYSLVNGVTTDIAKVTGDHAVSADVTIIDAGYIFAGKTIKINSSTAFYLVDTVDGTVTAAPMTPDASKTYTVTFTVPAASGDAVAAVYYTVS